MFRLNLTGAVERIDLPDGAWLDCEPLDYDVVLEVYRAVEPDETLDDMSRRLAARVVRGWGGIHDMGSDQEVPFDAALIPDMMRDPTVCSRFFIRYARRAFALADEGNGSGPSPNGASAAGSHTARTASGSTASDARPARTQSAAKGMTEAPSGRSRQPKRKPSGA